jgi:hypothetical protein
MYILTVQYSTVQVVPNISRNDPNNYSRRSFAARGSAQRFKVMKAISVKRGSEK